MAEAAIFECKHGHAWRQEVSEYQAHLMPSVWPHAVCPQCGAYRKRARLIKATGKGTRACDARCMTSRVGGCDCRCKGQNHGAGLTAETLA